MISKTTSFTVFAAISNRSRIMPKRICKKKLEARSLLSRNAVKIRRNGENRMRIWKKRRRGKQEN